MKTRLIFLILLIANFSCTTTNKPVTDTEKDKIKGEIKEVVNIMTKGWEELNMDMAFEPLLNSPDFVYSAYGKTQSYEEFIKSHKQEDMDMVVNNLKLTTVDEKYAVLDNSTVLYTTNCKWLVNMKDGSSSLYDPEVLLYIFKKIDGRWRVIYFMESFVMQSTNNSGS